jgi:hypothetical protein
VDIGPVRDPSYAGGFADIYHGRYEGFEVAVKKLRFFEEQRADIHRVSGGSSRVNVSHEHGLGFLQRSTRMETASSP